MAETVDIAAPWVLVSSDDIRDIPRLNRIEQASSHIPAEMREGLIKAGLNPTRRTGKHSAALARAGVLISMLPDLWEILACRVDRVAMLHSADDCFDVSHSDPAWSGLILVSMPPASPVGDLRLAEGIIHEAMHHNLSALEETVCLVATEARSYSPWKECDRPASGVLHGLYVFGCIAYALRQLIDLGALDAPQAAHARRRIVEIGEEFDAVDHDELRGVLSSVGCEVHAMAMNALRLSKLG
ncbi:MAG TPA: HEXXH motif-containing putative peptide modification protein [Sphingorhabdus lacus]|jgi:HEXXH motif-containing protein|nr:HEXXH motif-containing putative peptide modification protein [Sphingorhabdus lacus]HPV66743.1 HEXXH motif-containing putative peptide modification protein [Sphingorhabdus lacus]